VVNQISSEPEQRRSASARPRATTKTPASNFLDTRVTGAWPDAPRIRADSPERFLNRELSWLGFNHRVLSEADDPRHPLLERLRFLAISGSNLDEFYAVRLAGLRQLETEGVTRRSIDGLSPSEQLIKIDRACRDLMDEQELRWRALRAEMESEGVSLVGLESLSQEDRKWLSELFLRDVFPVLSPLAIDPAHPFPFIPNKSLTMALQLGKRSGSHSIDALMIIPSQLERFTRLPEAEDADRVRFVALEDMITLCLDRIFPGYDVLGSGLFRVLRDSDLEIEEEAEDLVREFEIALKRRRRGDVVRLKMNARTPPFLRDWIIRELQVDEHQVMEVDEIIGVADLSQLIVDDFPHLRWTPNITRSPERLAEFNNDCFAAIRHKDILLHHPYETFDVVIDFLEQAARDPNVLAIKQT